MNAIGVREEHVEMNERTLELMASTALRHISRNEELNAYVQRNPQLCAVLLKAAHRFIGGQTLGECIETAQTLHNRGVAVTVDYMGESTRDAAMAQRATEEFLRIIQTIAEPRLNASISLDLSHIGLVVDPELAFHNASSLAQAALDAGTEMMISMEGTERIDEILALHERLCQQFHNVGITLQAYLRRTIVDLARALQRPGRIRLVKGAFEEPKSVVEPRGETLDTAYCDFMEILLNNNHPCSIATHDPVMLGYAHKFIGQQKIAPTNFEFEMLYGVTPQRLKKMQSRGYHTRVYLPYGQEWYLYLCHRLAEYPPNIYLAIADAAGITTSSARK
jgi:proline dehydrogenase